MNIAFHASPKETFAINLQRVEDSLMFEDDDSWESSISLSAEPKELAKTAVNDTENCEFVVKMMDHHGHGRPTRKGKTGLLKSIFKSPFAIQSNSKLTLSRVALNKKSELLLKSQSLPRKIQTPGRMAPKDVTQKAKSQSHIHNLPQSEANPHEPEDVIMRRKMRIPSLITFDDGGFEFLAEDDDPSMMTALDTVREICPNPSSSFIKRLAEYSSDSGDAMDDPDHQKEKKSKKKKKKKEKKEKMCDLKKSKESEVLSSNQVIHEIGFGYQDALKLLNGEQQSLAEQLEIIAGKYEQKKSRENMSRFSDSITEPCSSISHGSEARSDVKSITKSAVSKSSNHSRNDKSIEMSQGEIFDFNEGTSITWAPPEFQEEKEKTNNDGLDKFSHLPYRQRSPRRSLRHYLENDPVEKTRKSKSLPGLEKEDTLSATESSHLVTKSLDGVVQEKAHRKKSKKSKDRGRSRHKSRRRENEESSCARSNTPTQPTKLVRPSSPPRSPTGNIGTRTSPSRTVNINGKSAYLLRKSSIRSIGSMRKVSRKTKDVRGASPLGLRKKAKSSTEEKASLKSVGAIKKKWDTYVTEETTGSAGIDALNEELVKIKGLIQVRKNALLEDDEECHFDDMDNMIERGAINRRIMLDKEGASMRFLQDDWKSYLGEKDSSMRSKYLERQVGLIKELRSHQKSLRAVESLLDEMNALRMEEEKVERKKRIKKLNALIKKEEGRVNSRSRYTGA